VFHVGCLLYRSSKGFLFGHTLGEQPPGLLDDLLLHLAEEVGELLVLDLRGGPGGRSAPFGARQKGVERRVRVVVA
jgi:hypothetical protein